MNDEEIFLWMMFEREYRRSWIIMCDFFFYWGIKIIMNIIIASSYEWYLKEENKKDWFHFFFGGKEWEL